MKKAVFSAAVLFPVLCFCESSPCSLSQSFCGAKPAIVKVTDLVKRINHYSDTTYIVNFWATWCPPCVQELPEIDTFGEKNKSTKIKVLLVSINYKEDYQSKLLPFIKDKKVKSEVLLLDENDFDYFPKMVDSRWNGDLPATLFLNNAKQYREIHQQKIDTEFLKKQLTAINAMPEKPKPPIVKVEELKKMYENKSDTVYIINFWATWCVPCVQEMPDFEKITAEYDSAKVKVIFVSLDFADDYDKKLLPFIHKHDIKSAVVLLDETNANYFIPLIEDRWSGTIPATLIIRNDKNAKEFYGMKLEYEFLKKRLDELLK